MHRCPYCNARLQQLGTVIDGPKPGERVWSGMNLWRCQECKSPHNRFEIVAGKPQEVAMTAR